MCIYLYLHQQWMLPPSLRQSMGRNGIWMFYSTHPWSLGGVLIFFQLVSHVSPLFHFFFCESTQPWVLPVLSLGYFSLFLLICFLHIMAMNISVCYRDFHSVRCLCIFSLLYKRIKFLVGNSDSLFLWHFVSCFRRYFPPQLYGKQSSLSEDNWY